MKLYSAFCLLGLATASSLTGVVSAGPEDVSQIEDGDPEIIEVFETPESFDSEDVEGDTVHDDEPSRRLRGNSKASISFQAGALPLDDEALAPPNDEFADLDSQGEDRDLQTRTAKSEGLYAIPYEAGVSVKVSRDHLTHSPAKNRIDMHGTSGGSYKIVAAMDGIVKYVEDSHNVNGGCANNNYIWIAHSNGEWTKYSHIAHDSASVQAGISVGDHVDVGQFLGIESDIGCASGDHLHWEVAVPDDLSDPITVSGGWIKGENLIPRICGISGNLYVAGTTYKVPMVRPGWGEYARHGLPHNKFQEDFNAAAKCDYRMDWNDGYDNGGTATFNAVYHANKSPALSWKSHRKLTKSDLLQKKSTYGSQGYKLVHIDVYNVGSSVYYVGIWHKGTSVPTTASYIGVSAATHQATFNYWTSLGWRPRVISATSVNGVRTYAAIYTYGSIGSWEARSSLTSSEYQSKYNANKDAGRRLIYLNSYLHNGSARYTAIWASTAEPNVYAKHGLSSAWYQYYYNQKAGSGWRTGAVTGMVINGNHRFAAYWEK